MTIEHTTDASRGEPLGLRAQKRKAELERALDDLSAKELRARDDIKRALSSIEPMLTGNLENLTDPTASQISRWLENTKHLAEATPSPAKPTTKGFVEDIESIAIQNEEFRRVLYTAKSCQLVVMSLKPDEDIGEEVHQLDQFFRVEEGSGVAVLDGVSRDIRAGFAVLVPAGTKHNIANNGQVPLKLYTLYAPPNHRDGVVHHTRADAEKDNEKFDGTTTETLPV